MAIRTIRSIMAVIAICAISDINAIRAIMTIIALGCHTYQNFSGVRAIRAIRASMAIQADMCGTDTKTTNKQEDYLNLVSLTLFCLLTFNIGIFLNVRVLSSPTIILFC